MENMNRKPSQIIVLKNMQIPYNTDTWQPRNFRGLERVKNGRIVNSEGSRNFVLFLDPEQVDCEKLIEDGWNITKRENPTDPQEAPSDTLRVKVKYHPENSDLVRLNPKVRVVNASGSEMEMDEENVGDLDNMQIQKANITLRATWQVTPTYTGYVAYLSKIVVRAYEESGSMDELMEGIFDD